jgi:NAD(P)-dependent dehydrogenase (short-subunit alcohol dehydrogenase family)
MTDTRKTSVLITGGNKGLGYEAARRLGERGWTIFLGSRDPGRGRAAAG